MASGVAIQRKLKAALKRLQATSRTVKLRSVSSSGGNALLGVGQTVTVTDVLVDPQPAVELLKPEEIAAAGGALLQLGDYRLTFDGSISEDTWKTSEILYGSDVLKIVSYEPAVIYGTVAAWVVLARTAKAS